MKTATHKQQNLAGFSLIEMLMTVAIIGIMVGMILPWYGNADQAAQAKHQRNAQTFCSLCTAAEAAGMALVRDGRSKEQVLEELVQGVTIQTGPLRGRTFRVPNVTTPDINGAAKFVKIQSGMLVYQSTGI